MSEYERKPGFYIYKNKELVEEIVYLTGHRKGNKYARRYQDDNYQMNWYSLLWNCVPTQTKLNEQYDYYETAPDGWWGPIPTDVEEDAAPVPSETTKKQFLCSENDPNSTRTCILQPGHPGLHSAMDDFGGSHYW